MVGVCAAYLQVTHHACELGSPRDRCAARTHLFSVLAQILTLMHILTLMLLPLKKSILPHMLQATATQFSPVHNILEVDGSQFIACCIQVRFPFFKPPDSDPLHEIAYIFLPKRYKCPVSGLLELSPYEVNPMNAQTSTQPQIQKLWPNHKKDCPQTYRIGA